MKQGNFCRAGEKTGKDIFDWGCEYSFACVYFPNADQLILLDWEFVPEETGEATISKFMMARLYKILKEKKYGSN